MLTPPDDLTAEQVSEFLRTHWALDTVDVSYAPVGHGSHNWIAVLADGTKRFVKAYRAGPNDDFFHATSQTAAAVREAGLAFVVGPIRDTSGGVCPYVAPEWQVTVHPFIEGRNPDFDTDERVPVAEALGRLHAYAPIPEVALHWEPSWLQPELRQLLADDLDRPWTGGPYGESARTLLIRSRSNVERLLAESDRLVGLMAESDQPWVMTHGEPHGGNTMLDGSGNGYLVDCDAMFYAPRERDLRLLLYGGHRVPKGLDNTAVLAAYQRGAGQPIQPRPFALELFRAEWHLIELCRDAWLFSGPHEDTADVRSAWRAFQEYTAVERNWPELPAK